MVDCDEKKEDEEDEKPEHYIAFRKKTNWKRVDLNEYEKLSDFYFDLIESEMGDCEEILKMKIFGHCMTVAATKARSQELMEEEAVRSLKSPAAKEERRLKGICRKIKQEEKRQKTKERSEEYKRLVEEKRDCKR